MSEPLDTLAKFGDEFQTKCVVALLNDRSFVEQSLDILEPKFFETDANRWTVEKIVWYFSEYKSLPTVVVLKKEADKIPDSQNSFRLAVIENLKSVYNVNKENPEDLKYVKDELLQFCRNQAMKLAVLKSVDYLQSGNYELIKIAFDKALHAGAERNIGHEWHTDFDKRVSKAARNTIATPWSCINEIMDGGLGAGELGVIVAPSGIGKSWILSKIGQYALTLGKTVAHYTLELSDTYTGLRYDTITTGIESNAIKNHITEVKNKIADVPGKLYIKNFPTRTVSVNGLRAHFERLKSLGINIDLIIIDYPDLLLSAQKANARHEELGYIYEDLRGMAGELILPIWGASQSQRSSLQDDVVEMDKIAGAYSKVMTADFIMSASRKIGDKITNTARIHVPKNRFGPDGLTFPAEMDLAHGKIEIYDENSPQGIMIKQKIQSGEGAIKSMMAKKFLDLSSKKEEPPKTYYLKSGE